MENQYYLSKYASIIDRQSRRYFDRELQPYAIGCGQQFFLLRIYENEGISVLDLAKLGYFDKGTTAKAIQKLEELGYIERATDTLDKRVHRLRITEKAQPLVKAAYAAREKWNEILTRGMTKAQRDAAQRLMERMAENAYAYMKEQGEELYHESKRNCETTKSTGV